MGRPTFAILAHREKQGIRASLTSLHVCITPAAFNASASQVCQTLGLYLVLLYWKMPFLCFIL